MRCNEAGRKLIKEFEGLRLKSYKCPADVWTIGYGHTNNVKEGEEITEKQADFYFDMDLRVCELAVSRLVKVELTENQFAALCSFVFNEGAGALQKSTLLKHLNNRWYDQVPAQLMKWIYAGGIQNGGLRRRRMAECELWRANA